MPSPLCCLRILALAVLVACTPDGEAQAQSPERLRTALEPFTGRWTGPFVVYRANGEPVDSLVAKHRYRWEGDVQVGVHVDRYPATGRVDTSRVRNYVEDGRLVCEVTGPDGTTTVHVGRLQDGAIIWHRRTDAGLVESYRERVVQTPEGREYRIDGFGAYPSDAGLTHVLFHGRYRAVQ